jgi:hypothetical protein
LREYAFDPDVFERAFIPFRIAKDLGKGRVRLMRVKEPLLESEEKLFALPDVIDEENGPFADFLDHITRLRVKLLNDLFDFEEKLTVDEVEDQLREQENNDFMEGKAVHAFYEISSILDFMPAGYENEDDETEGKPVAVEANDDDLPEIEEEEDEKMKNDASLRWDDEDDEEKEGGEPGANGDRNGEDREDNDKGGDTKEDDEEEAEEAEEGPPTRRGRRSKR